MEPEVLHSHLKPRQTVIQYLFLKDTLKYSPETGDTYTVI